MDTSTNKRSTTSPRPLPSRPTTPLRPSSRTSFRSSTAFDPSTASAVNPLASIEPAFAELADGMADLEANFMHLQLMHESLSRFSENFAAFLYGLNMNAFCVDFPEAPIADSFKRAKINDEINADGQIGASPGPATSAGRGGYDCDPDMTIVSTATSFVDHPSTVRSSTRNATPRGQTRERAGTVTRGAGRGAHGGRGTVGAGRTRPSGIARGARGRGVR